MKLHRHFKTAFLDKNFSTMTLPLRQMLFPALSTAAEQNDYLEGTSRHADAIGWHLGHIEIETFLAQLFMFFDILLISLRGRVNFLTVAFDETFQPYYGKNAEKSPWIHGYTNKIKGATGSYKFMVVSIVIGDLRFVLSAVPMAVSDNSVKLMGEMLVRIKKHFHVSLVLLDRGFASKELVHTMEKQQQQYIALCPRWKNVKRFQEQGLLDICENIRLRHHREETMVRMHYALAYGVLDHDWVFLTNTSLTGLDLVRAYKTRWGIETTFRVMDHADIKSKSTNIIIRTFFFLLSVVLYNMWIEQRKRTEVTFSQFLDSLALALTPLGQSLEKISKAKKFFGMPLTAQEKRVLSIMP